MATSHTRARRVKGLIAGACGAALLLAGGTWALWYDEGSVAGGKIRAGNLQLEPAGNLLLYDVSTITGTNAADHTFTNDPSDDRPRTDQTLTLGTDVGGCLSVDYANYKAHVANTAADADPKAWTASPGDTLLSVWPYHIALEGDNMVANLTVSKDLVSDPLGGWMNHDGSKPGLLGSSISEFEVTVYLQLADGSWLKKTAVDAAGPIPVGLSFIALLGADVSYTFEVQAKNEDAGQLDAPNPTNIPEIGLTEIPSNPSVANANACVIIKGTVNPQLGQLNLPTWTGEDNRMYASSDLLIMPDLKMTLEQTRARNTGNF